MKHKEKQIKKEGGITLIALIITIIVLVILAAVTLNSFFGSNIIGIATNGAINYAEEQQKELGLLNDVSDLLGDITGDTDRPMMPSVTLDGTKGNNDIFTSNVTVEISINRGIEQTGAIKIHYQINDGEEQITEEDVSLEVNTEGTTTIIVWAENERGNISDKQEVSFTINKTAPSNPTISLNGTEGDNNYYKSNVGVTINAGNASNISSIKYKVEGANPIEETEVQGTTANFEITADGTSTITAYIINTAGLTSETITEVVNKDTTPPSTANIALSGEAGETSITVNANGEDTTSGIASYIFQYSTTSETEGFTTKEEVQNTSNSCTFEYQDLTSDTTYYLKVVVKDRAGNTKESNVETVTTDKKIPLTETELANNKGKYVEYIPEIGTFNDHVGTTYNDYSGSPANSQMSTITDLKWLILDVDNNTLTLISETMANENFGLGGAKGYNNGVLLLNNACKAMYSNSDWATSRNLNIDDIEAYMTYNKTSYSYLDRYYGVEYSASEPDLYPTIYQDELTGAPGGVYGTKYGLSDQDNYITGLGESYRSSLKGKYTKYTFTMSTSTMDSQTYVDLFSSSSDTWLASRCAWFNSRWPYFCMFLISNNTVDAYSLYGIDTNATGTSNYSYALRPIVEIDLSKVNIIASEGSSTSPYTIEAK